MLLVVDPLRMGEATGTAIGSGASAGGVVLAVGQDALRFAGLVGYFRLATAAGSSVVGKLAAVPEGAQAAVRFDPSRAGHIFREATGHVNPASAGSQARFARLFEAIASNPANLRADAVNVGLITQQAAEAGLQAFTWTGRGGQVWVTVRNGVIQNAEVNPLGAFR